MGGRAQEHPLRQGQSLALCQNKRQPTGHARTATQSSAHPEWGPAQTPLAHVLSRPYHTHFTHTTVQAQELGTWSQGLPLPPHTNTWPAVLDSPSFQSPSSAGGAAGMVNPVLEMREQNFRVSVRTLSRRNQGRRHSASEALSLLGSGALAEGCLGPLPPPPPSPAPHSHWVMHKDPPAGACTPSGLPTHLLPQRHPGFTWGWLSLTFSHRPLHLPLGLTHFRTSQVPGALGVSFLHPVRP